MVRGLGPRMQGQGSIQGQAIHLVFRVQRQDIGGMAMMYGLGSGFRDQGSGFRV